MRKKSLKSRFKVKQQDTITLPENLTDESLLTREQAAVYLGHSVRTLIRRIKEGEIREVKHKGISRIQKGELDRFLADKSSGGSAKQPSYRPKLILTDHLRDLIHWGREESGERE